MNQFFNILIVVSTALAVMFYDYKYKRIPLSIILLNYFSVSIMISPVAIIGLIFILVLYKLDQPIDMAFMFLLATTMRLNLSSLVIVICMLLFVVFSKEKEMRFMVPIEISLLFRLAESLFNYI